MLKFVSKKFAITKHLYHDPAVEAVAACEMFGEISTVFRGADAAAKHLCRDAVLLVCLVICTMSTLQHSSNLHSKLTTNA